MDNDLEFIINALSIPNSPLTNGYSHDQLIEIRSSFITLQNILRDNPTAMEHVEKLMSPLVMKTTASAASQTSVLSRAKAGGDIPLLGGKSDSVLYGIHNKLKLPNLLMSRSSETIDRETSTTLSNIFHYSNTCSNWSMDYGAISQNDEDSFGKADASCGEPGKELVRYKPQSNDYDDCLDRTDSSTTMVASIAPSSAISISIPIRLMWSNDGYDPQSTDSETTLKADGLRFIARN
ncbi:uncharacterized protein [Drosophila tropicalis]|uniref:uncharacterized protein n=1 Tax=Drosophila tropicalis TaxID=46794 RepID=UPI0035ABBCB3